MVFLIYFLRASPLSIFEPSSHKPQITPEGFFKKAEKWIEAVLPTVGQRAQVPPSDLYFALTGITTWGRGGH